MQCNHGRTRPPLPLVRILLTFDYVKVFLNAFGAPEAIPSMFDLRFEAARLSQHENHDFTTELHENTCSAFQIHPGASWELPQCGCHNRGRMSSSHICWNHDGRFCDEGTHSQVYLEHCVRRLTALLRNHSNWIG